MGGRYTYFLHYYFPLDTTVLNLYFEYMESKLPAEITHTRAGAPKEVSALVSVDEQNGLRMFVDSKGNTHKETPRARRAFQDYFNMGRDRSLENLAVQYSEGTDPDWSGMKFESIHATLRQFSAKLDWQNRIRLELAADSARALASAHKAASKRKTARMGYAKMMQEAGAAIIQATGILDVGNLTAEEARQLLKPATTLLQVGIAAEKAEIGEAIERITPHKPIGEMTDDELEEFIGVVREVMQ